MLNTYWYHIQYPTCVWVHVWRGHYPDPIHISEQQKYS